MKKNNLPCVITAVAVVAVPCIANDAAEPKASDCPNIDFKIN